MHAFYTSLFWGGLLYVSIANVENEFWHSLVLLALLHLSIFSMSEDYTKNMSKPLTRQYFIKLLLAIALISALIYLSTIFENPFSRETSLSLGYVLIGSVWTYQIQHAWYKNKKYNKSLKQTG